MRRNLLIVGLAAALGAACGGVSAAEEGKPQGPPPATVRVAEVSRKTLLARWPAVGRLRELKRVVVSAEQQGRLVAVQAEEGLEVVGGKTVLAKVEDTWAAMNLREASARLDQARAHVAEAQAQLAQAKSDLTFLEELGTKGSAKPKEVEDARNTQAAREAAMQRATATRVEAEAAVDRAKTEVEKLVVLAPFDGVVVRKIAEVGQFVTQGSNVAEIVSRGQIDAVIDVPERWVNQLQAGQEVELTIESLGGKEVVGRIQAVVPDGTTPSRTFPVKVRLADEQGALKPGMSVTANVPSGEEVETLTVPRDAVVRSASGSSVWANVNGMALPVGVEVLFGQDGEYAVRTSAGNVGPPLTPGMQVVIEGAERLFPTRPLLVTNEAQVKGE